MTTNGMAMERPARVHWPWGETAIGASVLFVMCVGALHVLRTDLPPAVHVLSEYALGPSGWVMAVAFLALAAGFFALAMALRRDLHGWLGTLGIIAAVLAAVGSAMGGLFPMDPVGTPVEQFSTSARLHQMAFMLGGPGSLLAATFVNASLARHGNWRASRALLLATAAFVWLATIAFGASMAALMSQPAGGDLPPVGWFNRVLAGAWIVWIVALALRAHHRSGRLS